MIDGARSALAGYLYQIVASAGLAARAVDVLDDGSDGLMCTLIIEARNARILHEMHGEDLMLVRQKATGSSGTAVQFKFSKNGAVEVITPSELREILCAFHRCTAEAAAEFPITDYVLVTNRDLNQRIREHHGRCATPFDDLKQTDRDWLNVPESQREKIEKEFESVEASARAWYGVFQKLSLYPRVGTDYWYHALREYASARGLYDEEFDPALSRLVGDAIRNTLDGPAEFSQEWLNKCLFGFPDAHSLQISALDADSARHSAVEVLRGWMKDSHGISEQQLIRREYLRTLGDQLTQYPVVLVLGGGGCGKSSLASHFLLESARSSFVAGTSARDLRVQWLAHQFNAWRAPESGRLLPLHLDDDIPRRLRHANPNVPRPILVVNIDGLDEQGDGSWDSVRELVALCRSLRGAGVAEMALILTSRATAPDTDRARRNLLADLLSADDPFDVEGEFGVVVVDDFTEGEFGSVLQYADTGVRGRLAFSLRTGDGPPPDTTIAESEVSADFLPVSPNLVASLHHPVLWGVFARLTVKDQHRVLDGTVEGLNHLAERFVERFCRKANRRRPTLLTERVRRALIQIARSFPAHHRVADRPANWVTPVVQMITQDEASFLFDEAVSYGIIREEEPGQWTWRHRFLQTSLAAWENRR